MKAKDFFGKLMSLHLWGNLTAMAVVVVLLCVGVKYGIDLYTHHGEAIPVPDLKHRKFADAEAIIKGAELDIVVTDTGYVKTLPPDCILEQTPAAGQKVKSGHIVYVTINASSSPTLVIPDIVDNSSYREAKAKLIAMGFKLAEPRFIPGEKDWVYGVTSGGRSLNTGDRVPVDARLVILVGDGLRNEEDSVNFVDSEDTFIEDEYGDPTHENGITEEPNATEKDEFEVVTEPEQ